MSEEPEKLAEATLISHLLELRDRLIRAMVSVGLVLMPCVFYSNDIFTFIARPLIEKLPKGTTLIATGVMSPFTTPFKLSFFVALIIAMPYVLYQRSEEHTSELQSPCNLVCRLLLEKKTLSYDVGCN